MIKYPILFKKSKVFGRNSIRLNKRRQFLGGFNSASMFLWRGRTLNLAQTPENFFEIQIWLWCLKAKCCRAGLPHFVITQGR